MRLEWTQLLAVDYRWKFSILQSSMLENLDTFSTCIREIGQCRLMCIAENTNQGSNSDILSI